MIELGPRWSVVFAVAFLAAQGALILSASRRDDHAFGFRMFHESSTVEVALFREVAKPEGGTELVPAPNGEWSAKDHHGTSRRVKWRDRVREPGLQVIDRPAYATHGVAAHLVGLRAALDDVASHTPDDAETISLVADVVVRKNGHDPTYVRFTSAPRH